MDEKIYIVIPADEVIQRRKHRINVIITIGALLIWFGMIALYFWSVVCNYRYRSGQLC
jgi:hypothetical protein